MTLWFTHPSDALLAALAQGRLSGWRRRRVLHHARGCTRCADRHERLVLVERTLAGGDPNEPGPAELEALRRANRSAVLASVRGGAGERSGHRGRWVMAGAFVGLAVIGATTFLIQVPGDQAFSPEEVPPEFMARGAAQELPSGVLRVFCLEADGVPRMLSDEGACPVGATLAFAARFDPVPESLRIEVHGGASPEVQELVLSLEPGREAVLPFTLKLDSEGAREVQLHGGPQPLRQRVQVGTPP